MSAGGVDNAGGVIFHQPSSKQRSSFIFQSIQILLLQYFRGTFKGLESFFLNESLIYWLAAMFAIQV